MEEAEELDLGRLLQEREYFPLGSDTPKQLKARVVAATHSDPTRFRQDLYYRLRSYQVRLPRLGERIVDLPLLVDHFLELAAQDLEKPKPTVPAELFVHLADYDFPGNVRELQSMCFDAVARHPGGVMPIQAFLSQMKPMSKQSGPSAEAEQVGFPSPMPTLRTIERAAVVEALRRANGNQSAAARMLGISRPTISRHLRRPDQD
ncbi:MAG: helix-turn-helix domain-containing protein [Planctomycetota bacterium]